MNTLGLYLRLLRHRNGRALTAGEAAARAAISRRALYQFEGGEVLPTTATLERMLAALQVDDETRREAMRLWAQDKAAREGCDAATLASGSITEVAGGVTAVVLHALRRGGVAVSEPLASEVRACVAATLDRELAATLGRPPWPVKS
jgi:transcriptional regulator with XRE-family HTH domain